MAVIGRYRDALERVLHTLIELTGEGAIYQDMQSSLHVSGGNVCDYCVAGLDQAQTGAHCRQAIRAAAMASFASGEPYFYQCWAGLLCVAVSVAPRNRCLGALELGGFFAEDDSSVFHDVLAHHLAALSASERNRLLAVSGSLRPISAGALRGLGRLLLEMTYSHGLNSSDFMLEQNRRYCQQREIAEALQDAGHGASVLPSFHGNKEMPGVPADMYPLLNYLQHNDREQARRFVSGYLARLLMASHWDLRRLKAHLRLLTAVLTSESMLRGESWAAATSREMQQMVRLESADTTESACAVIADIVLERFARARPAPADRPALSERVLDWLRRHYAEKITLAGASRAIGASASGIVQHLRRDTRKSFHRHLVEIRVAEAKKLLACTQMEINLIAEMCGFADQSHFTRLFKRHINLTPGEFRRLLNLDIGSCHPVLYDGKSGP